MKDHIDDLLEILFDTLAREDERDDAAMYLWEYDDPRVLDAFFRVGSDEHQPDYLLQNAGEGIGYNWSRNNIFDLEKFKTLTDFPRHMALEIIRQTNSELLERYGFLPKNKASLDAFFKIGSDEHQPRFLLEDAGECIGEIWNKNNIFDPEKLKTLTDIARNAVLGFIRLENPELLKRHGFPRPKRPGKKEAMNFWNKKL